MSARRSLEQRRLDDEAFPIRVKIRVPPTGLGQDFTLAKRWLNAEVSSADFAEHPSPIRWGSGVAFYFRRMSDAARFLEAFPAFELADGTAQKVPAPPPSPGWG